MVRILFLAASPIDQPYLRIRQERNAIQHALDSAAYGKHFALIDAFDVNVNELQELLFRHQPHIVHFSGHGEADGELYLKDDNGLRQPVAPHALRNLFAQFKHTIQLVVLNACYSTAQASAITEEIDFVVGMAEAITDAAAVSFAEAFYRAAANAATLETMFELARNQLELKHSEEAHKPQLYQHNDPQQIRFISRDQLIVSLVQGMADLPTHYDGPVRNFLSYYLGSAATPAPFGGRDEDLARLDQWLAAPQTPRYLLLAAPAGRGKSALLAHWVAALMQREAVHIVFFPISIRFSTNRENVVFAALAARLARIYGEKLTPAIDAQQYRGVVSDYLQRTPPNGKPLLVILDGLDEAAGWEAGADLFPLHPPAQLRVVVAARLRANDSTGEGWLTQLGWETGLGSQFVLPTLDRDSVADVMAKMGNPLDALATKIDVVTKLHELSEGDPLLVRLYVEALLPYGSQMATFMPEDLLSLKPGLKAFFDRWFEEQKKLWNAVGLTAAPRDNAVNSLLTLCALAKGPLGRDDLFALAPNELQNGVTIDWAAETLNRFIIGDGSPENGYALGHPRLGYYFAERLPAQEYKNWSARFLSYGVQILTNLENKTIEPKDASPYVVRYYGAHLADAKVAPTAFYALVCEAWLRAWEWTDGTPDGFLRDAQRAWIAAEVEGPTAIGQNVRVALCHSSLVSLSANIPRNLLISCLQAGVISPQFALIVARAKPEILERAQCLAEINAYLGKHLQYQAIDEALIVASKIDYERDRLIVLRSIVKHFPPNAVDLASKVLVLAKVISEEADRIEMLNALAPHLSQIQQNSILNAIMTVLSTINITGEKVKALNNILKNFPSDIINHYFATIFAIVQKIDDPLSQATILRSLAIHFPKEQQVIIIGEAIRVAHTIDNLPIRIGMLCILANQLSLEEQVSILKKALMLIRNCNEQIREDGLRNFIDNLPPATADLAEEILQIVYTINDPTTRVGLLNALVIHFPPFQRSIILQEALTITRRIYDKSTRAIMLSSLAARLPLEHQLTVLSEALEVTRTIDNESSYTRTLGAIIERFPKEIDNSVSDLLVAASNVRYEGDRLKILGALAARLPIEQQSAILKGMLDLVRANNDKSFCIHVLQDLAKHFPLQQQTPILSEAWSLAGIIGDEWKRIYSLSMLLYYLPPIEHLGILNRALDSVKAITDVWKYVDALGMLAARLPLTHQIHIISEALNVIYSIKEERDRTSALHNLIGCLSVVAFELVEDILAAVQTISDHINRAEILCALMIRISSQQCYPVLNEILEAICSIDDKYALSYILEILNSNLSVIHSDLTSEAVAVILGHSHKSKYQGVLNELVIELQTRQQRLTLNEESKEMYLSSDERKSPPTTISDELTTPINVSSNLLLSINKVPTQYQESSAKPNVLPMNQIDVSSFHRNSEIAESLRLLKVFSSAKRTQLLSTIETLFPFIARLGGDRAIRETAQAILDTARWWP